MEVAIRSVTNEDGKRALVEIRDTGCGIPEHVMEHLFEAGYSGTGETPGLGLAVCRRLMTQHGGEIRVAPRGAGQQFSTGVSSDMTGDTQSSVMVVDDEPGIRAALKANFLRHGWQVEAASGVREAIRNLEHREFDLVVTDIRMPDGSGMEVMRAARKSSPGTAVILLTAYGSVPDAVNAMRDGALDYLTKPIPFDQLQATAAQVMERARLLPVADAATVGDILGHSPLLLRAIQRARAAAARAPMC